MPLCLPSLHPHRPTQPIASLYTPNMHILRISYHRISSSFLIVQLSLSFFNYVCIVAASHSCKFLSTELVQGVLSVPDLEACDGLLIFWDIWDPFYHPDGDPVSVVTLLVNLYIHTHTRTRARTRTHTHTHTIYICI